MTPEQRRLLEDELAFMAEMERDKPFLAEAFYTRKQNIAATLESRPGRSIDWVRLAELMVKHRPGNVLIAMREDWFWTARDVYAVGEPLYKHDVTFSNWATPVVVFDSFEPFECWMEIPDEETPPECWPDEAVAILTKAGLLCPRVDIC